MAKQEVKIIEDSVTPLGGRGTTFMLRYWRAIHAEVMTHRVFSRNASSSRAIPVKKVLKQVWSDAAGPTYWGSNKPGMQAGAELEGWKRTAAKLTWKLAAKAACCFAWTLMKLGVHKQVANRVLEPFQYISVMLTGTEFQNFFHLRAHKDAMPEFRDLAMCMRARMEASTPRELAEGDWHLPLVREGERVRYPIETLLKISTARNARVSFEKHDGGTATVEEECDLYDKLVAGDPIHASPTEHQFTFNKKAGYGLGGNLNCYGIVQHRKLIEQPSLAPLFIKGKEKCVTAPQLRAPRARSSTRKISPTPGITTTTRAASKSLKSQG